MIKYCVKRKKKGKRVGETDSKKKKEKGKEGQYFFEYIYLYNNK